MQYGTGESNQWLARDKEGARYCALCVSKVSQRFEHHKACVSFARNQASESTYTVVYNEEHFRLFLDM